MVMTTQSVPRIREMQLNLAVLRHAAEPPYGMVSVTPKPILAVVTTDFALVVRIQRISCAIIAEEILALASVVESSNIVEPNSRIAPALLVAISAFLYFPSSHLNLRGRKRPLET